MDRRRQVELNRSLDKVRPRKSPPLVAIVLQFAVTVAMLIAWAIWMLSI